MKNNKAEVIEFLQKIKRKKCIIDPIESLMLVNYYDNEFGYLNVGWNVELQLIYMFERLNQKYKTDNDER